MYQLTQNQYDSLHANSVGYILFSSENWIFDNYPVSLLSGSFNPIHDAHRFIYNKICYQRKAYELSLSHRWKESVTLEEINKRLLQFKNDENIVITNSPYFVQKAGLFNKPTFYIGTDVYGKLLEDITPHGVAGINARFRVNSRFIENISVRPNDQSMFGELPRNVQVSEIAIPEALMRLSSSDIRNNAI